MFTFYPGGDALSFLTVCLIRVFDSEDLFIKQFLILLKKFYYSAGYLTDSHSYGT